jgi:hypothetical protein
VAVVQLELRVIGFYSIYLVLVVISLCEFYSAFLKKACNSEHFVFGLVVLLSLLFIKKKKKKNNRLQNAYVPFILDLCGLLGMYT